MRERSVTIELEAATAGLVARGLGLVALKYGPEGKDPKAYHNATHTNDVIEAAGLLADAAIAKRKIEPKHKRLLLVAAAYHDTEQNLGRGKNERASASLAVKHMKEVRLFSEADCYLVRLAIMATQVYFDNGVMRQEAPNNYLARQLADADLAHLGRPTACYMDGVVNIFTEFNAGKNVSADAYSAFLADQVGFISNHQFYTPEANELFPHKEENKAAVFAHSMT